MRTRFSFRYFPGCFLSVVLLSLNVCFGHDDPNATVPSFSALKVDAPLVVDGILDEPFWQRAEAAKNFIDIRTDRPADQQTTVRIAYTRTHLYIAVECLDDKIDEIRATELREDRFFRGDDWVEVHLDPMHSHRAKYAFFSNPLGTRLDATEGPYGRFNTGWSAEWDLAAKIHKDRWTFEMRIPLAILNYKREDNQTWGINFTRNLVRTDVSSFWSYTPTDYYKPRNFGHLTGLDLAESRFDRNLEVTPYLSTHTDFNSDTQTEIQTGADINFRLTPSIITSWTVNPDFAQVEADADTIELRDTERFLPEKRLFFREGEELMRMRNTLYYSRRFSDIDAGAKVSGDWRDFKFSFLDIYGQTTHDYDFHGNSSVIRVLNNVGEKSNLGYYFSDSEFDMGHSRVASADGNLFLSEYFRVSYQFSLEDDNLPSDPNEAAQSGRDYLGYTSVNYEKYPWDIRLSYLGITEGFNPVLGYIPRRDIFGPSFRARYYARSSEQWYKSLLAELDIDYYENETHETALRDYSFVTGFALHNDMGFRFGHDEDFHAPYNNRRTTIGVDLNESDYWRSTEVGWGFGTFEQTEYDELMVAKRLKPFERWPIRHEFTVRFERPPGNQDDTVWLNRIIFDYFFSDDMWIKSSLQHRSTGVYNISLIYGWEFIRDAHCYLVFNSIDEEENGEPIHSIFAKLVYTFR
ncbi:MAG: carbohydrate binding family 9 domain-containing protein [Phycisphaerales bacterium]|nr:MAG: carbohydrate binding family 9 domain-containing protein [Phycisphaerales bacterium]